MHDDFQHIAIAIRPRLISLCRSFFDRQELACDAEDAVQETLLRLWQMRDRLYDYQHPEKLAMRIAKNVCIDMLKHWTVRSVYWPTRNPIIKPSYTMQREL